MGIAGGPNVLGDENLVFVYDTGDGNSYFGPPTTNIYGTSFRDFTGTTYSPDGEWTSNPTNLKKTYNSTLSTPIGPGATLIEESGSAGYHHLSRYGGGEESGAHSISCYLYPLSSDITDFTIGMLADSVNTIRFNLVTRAITYGAAISNRNAFIQDVPGAPGWLRVGANIEGRAGGWVGALGYAIDTSYTGTSGAKKCYITGIQYEYRTFITPFTSGTRSISGSLFDLSPNKNQLTLNTSYNTSSGQFIFDGTDDFISIAGTINLGSTLTILSWIKPSTLAGGDYIVYGLDANGSDNWFGINANTVNLFATQTSDVNNFILNGGSITSTESWYHIGTTINGNTAKIYLNGVEVGTTTVGFTIGAWDSNNGVAIGRRGTIAQRYFPGSISNTQAYNRVLLASEILQNYNAQKSRFNL